VYEQDLALLLGQIGLMQYEMYLADVRRLKKRANTAKREGFTDDYEEDADSRGTDAQDAMAMKTGGSSSESALKNYAALRLLQGTWNASNPAQRTAALVGMDMHPRRNAEQGLACLGSRKQGVAVGNRLLGMLAVEMNNKQRQSWVPGYCMENTHRLLIATECSILAPGPRCVQHFSCWLVLHSI
jgi:hypothetical protein